MSVSYARMAGAASILALTTSTGWADVTAQDVWSDWTSYLSGMGYDISATESSSGGVLTVSNISVGMPVPDGQGNLTITMPELVLSENGDGTVNVAFPDEFPMETSIVIEGEDPVDIVLSYGHQDHLMTVSGTPEDMTTEYSAAAVEVALDSLSVEGEEVPSTVLTGSMTMTNYGTTTRSLLSDIREYDQVLSADSLTYHFSFQDPESDDQGSLRGSLQDVGFEGGADIPLETIDSSDMRAMLDAGFAFDGDFTYGSGSSSMSGTGDGDIFAFESSSQGGVLGIGMNSEHLAYDLLQEGLSITISSGPCCTNQLRGSFYESSVVAGGYEQLVPYEVQDQELAFVQHGAKAARFAINLV